jgi:hypothetical protein
MNVPKFLWSEAVMTATYLINRMPSRVLGMKTPYEMIYGKNEFIVPPKVFGCTCFVRDHRPSMGKLDPRAVKCIFIGYPSGQKGYKCWSPSERRTFVSMDMTFRESEPFYGEKTDLSSLFDFDSPSTSDASREGESEQLRIKKDEPSRVVTGSIPYPMSEERWRKPNEEENLRVYTRRQSQHQQHAQTNGEVELQGEQHQQQQIPVVVEVDAYESEPCVLDDSLNLPIALRKEPRAAAGKPLKRYGFEHDIASYVSYNSLSSEYRAFIASLQSVVIPSDWRAAKQDPKWHDAMLEEMAALEKNKTWELVSLPKGKKPVNCKWVYTVKQDPNGKIERYKARLVAKGYCQTWN